MAIKYHQTQTVDHSLPKRQRNRAHIMTYSLCASLSFKWKSNSETQPRDIPADSNPLPDPKSGSIKETKPQEKLIWAPGPLQGQKPRNETPPPSYTTPTPPSLCDPTTQPQPKMEECASQQAPRARNPDAPPPRAKRKMPITVAWATDTGAACVFGALISWTIGAGIAWTAPAAMVWLVGLGCIWLIENELGYEQWFQRHQEWYLRYEQWRLKYEQWRRSQLA